MEMQMKQEMSVPQNRGSELTAALRRDADEHTSKRINLQSIHFQQGREIAQTYVAMMKSYARLDAQSGRYERDGSKRIVSGFCRIEELHFEEPLLKRERKQSFWTAQWSETITLRPRTDLFEAFCTSFSEFCENENINIQPMCALVRTKDGKTELRTFPVTTVLPECVEAIGFPYQIQF